MDELKIITEDEKILINKKICEKDKKFLNALKTPVDIEAFYINAKIIHLLNATESTFEFLRHELIRDLDLEVLYNPYFMRKYTIFDDVHDLFKYIYNFLLSDFEKADAEIRKYTILENFEELQDTAISFFIKYYFE